MMARPSHPFRVRFLRTGVEDERGVVALEHAIIFGFLIAILMLTFHVTFLFLASEAADDAASEALEVVTELGGSPGDGEAVAASLLDGDFALATWNVDIVANDTVTITVSGTSKAFFPGLPTTVGRHVEGPKERFIAEADR